MDGLLLKGRQGNAAGMEQTMNVPAKPKAKIAAARRHINDVAASAR